MPIELIKLALRALHRGHRIVREAHARRLSLMDDSRGALVGKAMKGPCAILEVPAQTTDSLIQVSPEVLNGLRHLVSQPGRLCLRCDTDVADSALDPCPELRLLLCCSSGSANGDLQALHAALHGAPLLGAATSGWPRAALGLRRPSPGGGPGPGLQLLHAGLDMPQALAHGLGLQGGLIGALHLRLQERDVGAAVSQQPVALPRP
mmetsp:Transcript_110836/g.357773  ORF Transcript_110836/g.357773 Transcript_110836/m.357773 type:complete len:206 (-) Transcript_110836:135-752(-)